MNTASRCILDRVILWRGGWPIARDISVDWRPGYAVLVTGPNGSGKTTLLRLLAGLLDHPDHPQWYHDDNTPAAPPDRVYYGFRAPVKAGLLVSEHLDYWAALYGAQPPGDDILYRLGLNRVRAQYGRTLSEGQKKRLDLCRLLMSGAPCWIMDEPLAGLDQQAQDCVQDMIRQHLDHGGWVALASHQPIAGFAHDIIPIAPHHAGAA